MALTAGMCLGPYEVVSSLKILPGTRADDPQFRERLESNVATRPRVRARGTSAPSPPRPVIPSDTRTDLRVEIGRLTKRFGATVAIEELSFTARDGEFVTLVGPSGCGKSTTLRIIAGLLKPSGGIVRVNQLDVGGPVRDAAMVFQSPVLLPWRRLIDNVLFTAEMRGEPRDAARARAAALIELAGLEGFEDRHPHELSGGMQQRVAICRALLMQPSLLLMDEPFGALDILTRERLGFQLQHIWEANRSTVLFVTHSITEAVLLSDTVIVFSPRPARIRSVVSVDLPRPRDTATLRDERFLDLSGEIRNHMESEWPD